MEEKQELEEKSKSFSEDFNKRGETSRDFKRKKQEMSNKNTWETNNRNMRKWEGGGEIKRVYKSSEDFNKKKSREWETYVDFNKKNNSVQKK